MSTGQASQPTYTLTLTLDGGQKRVVDYFGLEAGMPDSIADLEAAVDDVSDVARWTKGNANTSSSLRAEKWDFKKRSLENGWTIAGVAHYGDIVALRDMIALGLPVIPLAGPGDDWRREHNSALVNAAARRDPAMVEVLLDAGAWKDKDALGDALIVGALSGNPLLVREIMRYRSALTPDREVGGKTALMTAANSGVPGAVLQLLDWGASAKHANGDGVTALMLAAQKPYRDDEGDTPGADRRRTIQMLIKAGANVDARDKNGDTALTLNSDSVTVARALISANANVNVQNKDGETALMCSENSDVTALLLNAGADPFLKNKAGKTALEVMILDRRNGRASAVKVLAWWIKTHTP